MNPKQTRQLKKTFGEDGYNKFMVQLEELAGIRQDLPLFYGIIDKKVRKWLNSHHIMYCDLTVKENPYPLWPGEEPENTIVECYRPNGKYFRMLTHVDHSFTDEDFEFIAQSFAMGVMKANERDEVKAKMEAIDKRESNSKHDRQ